MWMICLCKAAVTLCIVWQDWHNIELIHIFQEQLITGSRFLTTERRSQSNLEGLVNLQNATTFDEHFFLVVVERTEASSSAFCSCTVHMWCIVISSQGIYVSCQWPCNSHFMLLVFAVLWEQLLFDLRINGGKSGFEWVTNRQTHTHCYWL